MHRQLGLGGGLGGGTGWVPEPAWQNAKIAGKLVCSLELSWVLFNDDQIIYCSSQAFSTGKEEADIYNLL